MHIRFLDDDDGQGPGPSPAAAVPHPAAHAAFAGTPGFQCVSSIRVDFNKDATYVFDLCHNGAGLVAASLSNTRIKLFNFRCLEAAGCGAEAAQGTGRRLPPPPPLPGRRRPLHTPPTRCCSEGGLTFAGDLVGHEGMVRELSFALPDQPHLLHSCAADGTVRGWDARVGQQVER